MNATHSELTEACLSIIKAAAAPLTTSQVASAIRGGKKPSNKLIIEVTGQLHQLLNSSQIFEWPESRRSALFWHRSLRHAVEEAFILALESQPLTLSKAAKPVSSRLKGVSEKRALAELKLAALPLAESQRITKVDANRQTAVFLSFTYLSRLLPPAAQDQKISMAPAILTAVERLQSGPGNYVRIDHLRSEPELRKHLDDAAIQLAREGKLVLARYDGPRPVPDHDKWNYVEDDKGELFIGIALPRGERVLA